MIEISFVSMLDWQGVFPMLKYLPSFTNIIEPLKIMHLERIM